VTGFSDNSATSSTTRSRPTSTAGKKKIILDLRGNPGGYVTRRARIASEFIAAARSSGSRTPTAPDRDDATRRGGLATRRHQARRPRRQGQRLGQRDRRGRAPGPQRATLVGETTFGKGTVQQWIELQRRSRLKLTIAKWLTPDKHWIHHVGISPDVPVATRPTAPTRTRRSTRPSRLSRRPR
jgi:carboxyl-terminal processing protease